GRGARLERTAAQHLRARRRDALGGLHDLLFAFDRARSGHDDELIAADFEAVDLDGGVLLAELAADELVGRGNAHGAFDTGRGFERFEAGGDIADADDADDDALFALDRVDFVPELADTFAAVVDFLARGVLARWDGRWHCNKKPTPQRSGLV